MAMLPTVFRLQTLPMWAHHARSLAGLGMTKWGLRYAKPKAWNNKRVVRVAMWAPSLSFNRLSVIAHARFCHPELYPEPCPERSEGSRRTPRDFSRLAYQLLRSP